MGIYVCLEFFVNTQEEEQVFNRHRSSCKSWMGAWFTSLLLVSPPTSDTSTTMDHHIAMASALCIPPRKKIISWVKREKVITYRVKLLTSTT